MRERYIEVKGLDINKEIKGRKEGLNLGALGIWRIVYPRQLTPTTMLYIVFISFININISILTWVVNATHPAKQSRVFFAVCLL